MIIKDVCIIKFNSPDRKGRAYTKDTKVTLSTNFKNVKTKDDGLYADIEIDGE